MDEIRFEKNDRRPEPGNGRAPDPHAGRRFPGRRRGGRSRQRGVRHLGKTSAIGRQRILLEIADRIQKRARDYAELETLNVGKPIRESMNIDIPMAIDHYRYFAGVLRNIQGLTQSIDQYMLHFTLREPLGVVGHILP